MNINKTYKRNQVIGFLLYCLSAILNYPSIFYNFIIAVLINTKEKEEAINYFSVVQSSVITFIVVFTFIYLYKKIKDFGLKATVDKPILGGAYRGVVHMFFPLTLFIGFEIVTRSNGKYIEILETYLFFTALTLFTSKIVEGISRSFFGWTWLKINTDK